MKKLILPRDLYMKLEKNAIAKGFKSVDEYVENLIEHAIITHAKNAGERT